MYVLVRARLAVPSCLILSALLVACSGCGGEKFEKPVAVSGKVTIKGKPLKEGIINFAPVDRKNAPFGRGTIEDGNYVASSLGEEDGLVPGEYQIFFDVNPDGEKGTGRQEIPAKYMTPNGSGLKKLIDAETDSLDFNLE